MAAYWRLVTHAVWEVLRLGSSTWHVLCGRQTKLNACLAPTAVVAGCIARRLALVPELAAAGQNRWLQPPSRSQASFNVERLLSDFEFSNLRDRTRCRGAIRERATAAP